LFTALLIGVIGGLASAVAASNGHVQTLWVVIAVGLVFLRVTLKSATRRARITYTITDQRLTIRTGLFSRDVHETWLDHVVDVQSRQTMLERLLGIGTIDVDTAGGADYDFCLRGVTEPREIARAVTGALRR